MSDSSNSLALAKDSLLTQAKALQAVAENLGEEFYQAIDMILACKGRVVLCGMGKSGLVGKKIAATLASTGTASFFMHPAEAFHGDLGMLTMDDLLILISYSGETEEVIRLLPSLKYSKNNIISIVGEQNSTLGKNSHIILNVKVEREVCPNNLAPTTSTLTTMAMGDALAVALIKIRNFQASDFARFHPGGSLGKRLLTQVKDVMYQQNLPMVSSDVNLKQAILVITQGRLGLVVVVDAEKRVKGIFTDGDLRRAICAEVDLQQLKVEEVMTSTPLTITADTQFYDAEALMLKKKVKAVLVIDEASRLIGIVDIFDHS